jgi:hypothetical protein
VACPLRGCKFSGVRAGQRIVAAVLRPRGQSGSAQAVRDNQTFTLHPPANPCHAMNKMGLAIVMEHND